jgi:hypothetical protein
MVMVYAPYVCCEHRHSCCNNTCCLHLRFELVEEALCQHPVPEVVGACMAFQILRSAVCQTVAPVRSDAEAKRPLRDSTTWRRAAADWLAVACAPICISKPSLVYDSGHACTMGQKVAVRM